MTFNPSSFLAPPSQYLIPPASTPSLCLPERIDKGAEPSHPRLVEVAANCPQLGIFLPTLRVQCFPAVMCDSESLPEGAGLNFSVNREQPPSDSQTFVR